MKLDDKDRKLDKEFILDNFTCSIDSGAHSIFLREFVKSDQYGKFGGDQRENADYSYLESDGFKASLEKYIQYVHEYKDLLEFYVSLDAIGSNETSAKKSWEICKYMESCGLNPMPVYHFGEPIEWLFKILDEYEYFGIGGLGQDITKDKYHIHGDKVFNNICGKNNKPTHKVHGFAMTSSELILKYPWYSVDSSTWTYAARSGSIMTPKPIIKKGEAIDFDYTSVATQLAVSDRRSDKDSSHYANRCNIHQKAIDFYLSTYGFSYENVSTSYHYRDIVNAVYMSRLEKASREVFKEKYGTNGVKIYLAGTPSGASSTLRKFVNLLHDCNLEFPRFLGSIEYPGMMNTLIKVKESQTLNIDLRDLQIKKEKTAIVKKSLNRKKKTKSYIISYKIRCEKDVTKMNKNELNTLTKNTVPESIVEVK